MKMMSSSTAEPIDLLDLKLLPAWVKEPEARSYEHYAGEEEGGELRSRQRPPRSERERRTSDFRSGEHSRSQANKKQPARLRKKMGGREYRLHEAKNRPSQNRHYAIGSNQRKFLECRAMQVERHTSWPD